MPRKHRSPVHVRFSEMKGCGEKVRYASEALADEAALLRELQYPNLRLETYQCPACKKWHLTSVKGTQTH